jgi:hypothetical protein
MENTFAVRNRGERGWISCSWSRNRGEEGRGETTPPGVEAKVNGDGEHLRGVEIEVNKDGGGQTLLLLNERTGDRIIFVLSNSRLT